MNRLENILSKGKYVVVVALVVFAIIEIWQFISLPWLWFDEAGQFWISKGLHHQSHPYSTPQGLWQVIESNRYNNLDPGGFSVLLYFWLLISDNYIFVRVFPLLFFIGFAYLFYKYLFTLTNNTFFSVIFSVCLFIYPITVSRMVELRAYSMELMGLVWALILLDKCKKTDYTPKSLLALSSCMAVFCTSRYEYIVFAFVVGVYTFIQIIRSKKQLWKKLLVFCTPLLVCVSAIIFLMLPYQNPSLSKMSYLMYLSETPSLFYHRFFLVYLLNTVIVLFSYYRKRQITQLQVISLSVSTLFVILSILGKYPWDKIRTISVVVVLSLNLMNEIYHHINVQKIRHIGDYLRVGTVMMLCYFLCGYVPVHSEDSLYEAFVYATDQKGDKVIYLDYWFTPSVRYMYEYGLYADRAEKDGYPDSFRFQIMNEEQLNQKIKDPSEYNLPNNTEADLYLICQIYRSNLLNTSESLKKIRLWLYTKKDDQEQ